MRRKKLLTAREVASIARTGSDGRYAVGCDCLGSLMLSIRDNGKMRSVVWMYRRMIGGKRVDIGLGPYSPKAEDPGSLSVVRDYAPAGPRRNRCERSAVRVHARFC